MVENVAVNEVVDLLWLTAGLSCDGDSVAMTAATQPALEDLIAGTLPGAPRLRLHHPVLAYEVGDEFLEVFRRAATGDIDPFVLVVEGSLPDERAVGEGCWAAFGEPPGARMSASAVVLYGRTVRARREVTRASMKVVPDWRRR